MKVKIKNWHSVTYWHWDVPDQDDLCGICRVSFDGTCPQCSYPGDDCPLVVGECHHNFHMHCISKWLDTESSKGLCPMCRQEFKISASSAEIAEGNVHNINRTPGGISANGAVATTAAVATRITATTAATTATAMTTTAGGGHTEEEANVVRDFSGRMDILRGLPDE